MTDISAGASIVMASCADERHLPEDALDPSEQKYWVTDGCYPAELVIKLARPSKVSKLRTSTRGVRNFSLHVCADERLDAGGEFKPVFEVELADKPADAAQVESHKVSVKRALFLKIRVESGWGDFSSVHAVSVF